MRESGRIWKVWNKEIPVAVLHGLVVMQFSVTLLSRDGELLYDAYGVVTFNEMENFDGEILMNCWKLVNIFSHQNFAPYDI